MQILQRRPYNNPLQQIQKLRCAERNMCEIDDRLTPTKDRILCFYYVATCLTHALSAAHKHHL